MYPDFHYLLRSLFGTDIPAIGILKTFGFFVALAFIAAALVIQAELKRKARLGLFMPAENTVTEGQAPQLKDWISNAIIGFILGYKVTGMFQNYTEAAADPIQYMISLKGSLIGGIVVGGLMGYFRYREKKKAQLAQPVQKTYKIFPHHRLMDIVFIAAAAGFIGAKVFNAFESWDDFVQDPVHNLISSGGFTFYGGLICATVALYIYARKKNFSFAQLCDAAAPALMIAYAVGRLGCHFSGDGDWGIYNSAYTSNADASLTEQVDSKAFDTLVRSNPELFSEFEKYKMVPHKHFEAPSFLPRWTVAMNYAHNVNREGIVIQGDDSYYNRVLPAGVFPTPVYEFFACSILFLILMTVRKRFDVPLRLFGLYLVFNGLERFFIEKIRVNYKYDWFFNLTQAEIISSLLIIAGLVLLFRKGRKQEVVYQPGTSGTI